MKSFPRDVIFVDRPSRWSNPFFIPDYRAIPWTTIELAARLGRSVRSFRCATKKEAVEKFEKALLEGSLEITPIMIWTELKGLDIACFDRVNQPSHADILLRIANGPRPK
jgi:hypothetical protein